MSKLKISLSSFSDDASILEASQAAATAAGVSAEPAQVVKDSSGRAVQAIIAIPGADTAGLTNARAKVSENPGIATAVQFPLCNEDADGDLEAFANGTTNPDWLFPGKGGSWYRGTSKVVNVNPITGAQSLKLVDSAQLPASTFHRAENGWQFDIRTLNLQSFSIASWEMKLKMDETGRGDNNWQSYVTMIGQFGRLIARSQDVNWQFFDSNVYYDLGVPRTQVLDAKVLMNTLLDRIEVYAGGVLKHTISKSISDAQGPTVGISANEFDSYLAATAHTPKGILVDDVKFCIIEGMF